MLNNQQLKSWLIIIAIILIVIGGGLFVLNQFFAWHYKAYLLQKPCDLCVELNPNYTRCQVEINQQVQHNDLNTTNWNDMIILPNESNTP
jgi:hypothetical protein